MSSSMNRLNSVGERKNPCRTPNVTGTAMDRGWLTLKLCDLFRRKEVNQFSTNPDKPILYYKRSSRLSCLTVSKAKDKSSRISGQVSFWSRIFSVSSTMWVIADSVLCPARTSVWKLLSRWKLVMWLSNWLRTHFSRSFARVGMLEIGRQLFKSVGSAIIFLGWGKLVPI